MRRQFTETVSERFPKGRECDYPKATWDQIVRNVGKPLDKFTKAVDPDHKPIRSRTKKGSSDGAASARV